MTVETLLRRIALSVLVCVPVVLVALGAARAQDQGPSRYPSMDEFHSNPHPETGPREMPCPNDVLIEYVRDIARRMSQQFHRTYRVYVLPYSKEYDNKPGVGCSVCKHVEGDSRHVSHWIYGPMVCAIPEDPKLDEFAVDPKNPVDDEFGHGGGPGGDEFGHAPKDTGGSGDRDRTSTTAEDKSPCPKELPARAIARICDHQKLAALTFRRYGRGIPPIAIMKLANGNQPDTYVVLLQGMEPGVLGLTDALGPYLQNAMDLRAKMIGLAMGGDPYGHAIEDALSTLPSGAHIVFVGHSLGGIEGQLEAAKIAAARSDPKADGRHDLQVDQVVTYGAPIIGAKAPGTHYLYVKAQGDLIAAADQRLDAGSNTVQIPGGTSPNPLDPQSSHQIYATSQALAQYRFPCFELDLGTFRGFWGPTTPATRPEPSLGLDCSHIEGDLGSPVVPPAEARGLRPEDDRAFRDVAAREQKIILVRDSNPDALRWIGRRGYLPKPMGLKAKTLRSGTYAGLAAASDLASADCYEKLNYRVRRDQDLVLEHKDTGVRYFSDFDLHGVYDAGGRDAWGADVWTKLNRALGAHGVKHAPHDEWLLRNSVEAGPNRGPQIGDGKAVTAYLPDGSVEHLTTLAAMKRFYCQHHIPWPYLD